MVRSKDGRIYWVEFKDDKVFKVYRELTGVEVIEKVRVNDDVSMPEEYERYKRIRDFYAKLVRWLNSLADEGYRYIVEKKDGVTLVKIIDGKLGELVAVITSSSEPNIKLK